MIAMKISILSVLFIFAIAGHAWSGPDKSMKNAANSVTTVKINKNKGLLQKKVKPASKPVKSPKKSNTKPQSAPCCPDVEPIPEIAKKDVDFLKAIQERKETRWIGLYPTIYSSEFLPAGLTPAVFISREVPAGKTSSKPFPVGSRYFEGGMKLETLRRLESRKEELLREIFMGLRFSFTPASRQMVLQMNVATPSEEVPSLTVPF